MNREEAIGRIQEHRRIHSKKEPFTPYLDEAFDMAIEALERGFYWRSKPLPSATHCLVAIKWAPDDIEVTEADTTFLLKEHSERIVAWMPLPDPPKGGDS